MLRLVGCFRRKLLANFKSKTHTQIQKQYLKQTHKINTIKDHNILKPHLNPSNYLHSISLIFKTSYFQYHDIPFKSSFNPLNSLHYFKLSTLKTIDFPQSQHVIYIPYTQKPCFSANMTRSPCFSSVDPYFI